MARDRLMVRVKRLLAISFAAFFLVIGVGVAIAQTGPEGSPGREAPLVEAIAEPDPGPPPPGPFGVAVRRPVLGGACPGCPWGAVADKVQEAMALEGYDVQVCHNCSGTDAIRIVDERRHPGRPLPRQIALGARTPPDAPVDFGVTEGEFLYYAYHQMERYSDDPPRTSLRLIARIENPTWYLVAVRRGSAITSLADIAAKHLPAIIIMDDKVLGAHILSYYGITEADLVSWGGKIIRASDPDRVNYSVILNFASGLNNTPESGIWSELSQTSNMTFLQLPEDLLTQLTGPVWSVRPSPVGMIRGMDRSMPTLVSSGTVIFGRADLPDSFAYDVARALDRHHDLFKWSLLAFSYEPERVWNFADVPLHPGAASYYRDQGYMPR